MRLYTRNKRLDWAKSGVQSLHPATRSKQSDEADYIWTPRAWSRSAVIMFFKKGDKTLLKNCRPISLLSHVYKLFTRVITNRLARRLDEFQPFQRLCTTRKPLTLLNPGLFWSPWNGAKSIGDIFKCWEICMMLQLWLFKYRTNSLNLCACIEEWDLQMISSLWLKPCKPGWFFSSHWTPDEPR